MTINIAINGPTPDADRTIWTADVIVKEQGKPNKEQSWLTAAGLDDLFQTMPAILRNLCQPKL